MIKPFHLFIAALAAGSVAARPGLGLQYRCPFAEAAAGIDIQASIAAASSSAAAVAATQTVNPTDPFPVNNHGLTPEELGQLAGLRAKLAIDTQFGDTAAEIKDNADIPSLESENDFTGAI
ncbi:hypothetical protein B0H14DRAFT_2621648 [Mycena olivaceomarginata]|nr:hypothetical protein B0H14DRAFT_2621648 [Mycena olivaceomarginata]